MQVSFDDGTLLLEDAPDTVPYAEWDDRVDEYRARAHSSTVTSGSGPMELTDKSLSPNPQQLSNLSPTMLAAILSSFQTICSH